MTKSVLSFGAHPDDIELGCAGSEIQWHKQGYTIIHACVSSGESGSSHIPKHILKEQREQEARNAARIIGAETVFFLGSPDGFIEHTQDLKLKVIDLIRKIQPEIICVHASSDSFRDHVIVHQVVLDASFVAGGPSFQGAPWHTPTVLGYEVWHPMSRFQYLVDISEVMEQKLEAIRAHRSQVEAVRFDEAFHGLAKYRGGLSGCQFAEVFEVIRTGNQHAT